jgi:putative ABC transport system permease protein
MAADGSTSGWRRAFHLGLARGVPRDVDAELRFHLEERIEELMAERGLSRAEAEALAQSRFGDVRRVRAELEAIDRAGYRRRARGEWLSTLARDARIGVRSLGRSPGFTVAAVLTLALAIGANTAIFSAVNAVLLKPLPTAALDRLVVVENDLPALNLRNAELSPGESEDLFRRTDLFETATAYTRRRPTLEGMGEPRQLQATRSLGRFFDVFGVRPLLGRVYRPDESEEGHHRVVVLSFATWQDLYGGDPAIVGKPMTLNGSDYEIVGVLPRDFRHPRGSDIYQPLLMDKDLRSPVGRSRLFMTFVGRLRPDVTPERLREGLAAEMRRWRGENPGQRSVEGEGPLARALPTTPFIDHLAGKLRPVLAVLMGAVVLVLLIACANVASLQLVRSAGRAREIAVRAALGARRSGIVRQLVVESLLLAVAGGAIGLLLGQLIVALLRHVAPAQFPQLEGLALDVRVLAFTGVIAVGAGLLFGLLPALPASRADLTRALKAGDGRGASAGGAQRRLLQGSVVVQVALTLVLLLGSTLVVRSLVGLLELDPGFRAERVVTMKVTPPGAKYPREQGARFYRDLVDRVRTLPGVQAAGVAFGLPFTGDQDSSPFDIPGIAKSAGTPDRHAEYRVVEGEYFRALGIPVKRGRTFTASDAMGAGNVVMIDESLAKEYFGDVDPVGRTLAQLGSPSGNEWTIVGVVGSVMRAELGEAIKPTIYYHLPQVPWYSGLALAVRTTGDERAAVQSLRAVVRDFEKDALVTDVRSMQERVDRSLGARRLAVWVLSGFGALALMLAVLGIYGVMSYGMTQRRQEIGIRIALGATARDVTRMVLAQGLRLAGLGLVVGLVAFLALGRALEALLYGIAARDPLTLVTVALTVAVAALLASWVPGRRAGRTGTDVLLRA